MKLPCQLNPVHCDMPDSGHRTADAQRHASQIHRLPVGGAVLLVGGITINQLNYCTGGSSGDVLAPAAIAYTVGIITVPPWLRCTTSLP